MIYGIIYSNFIAALMIRHEGFMIKQAVPSTVYWQTLLQDNIVETAPQKSL
jgi:hypothetical protein